ncbi:hypothetical protein F2Q68_00024565 [Brassica cretica]|uniref:Uncharacterized protein n=1 Tax=Brassica cretica TaxID=69181 RepID=A0A8S9IAW8_BRACR|nr:hypothetical protein F2Q68_00024565 [Brassica cretica]
MVTPIKTKQETFRSRFEGEHKDGGRYVASEGQTGRYVASGSKPRRVLLVFVVKSQRKHRLRRNEKRFDENSNENAKEDLSEALQPPEHLFSDLLHYADDPHGHAGLHCCPEQVSKAQPCLAAQY